MNNLFRRVNLISIRWFCFVFIFLRVLEVALLVSTQYFPKVLIPTQRMLNLISSPISMVRYRVKMCLAVHVGQLYEMPVVSLYSYV